MERTNAVHMTAATGPMQMNTRRTSMLSMLDRLKRCALSCSLRSEVYIAAGVASTRSLCSKSE